MKKSVIFLVFLILACTSIKKPLILDYDYLASIPSSLKEDARSTYRLSDVVLEINSTSSATYRVKEALTIYDKEDKDLARIVLFYDKFKKIDYLTARIRDNSGAVIKTFDIDDAYDYSASGGGTFFSDNRVKVLELLHNRFPYTIEYEYQNTYSGLLNLPTWRPQWYEQSVEQASFTLIDKSNSGVRYFPRNLDDEPQIVDDLNGKKYVWKVSDLEAKKRETYGPPQNEVLPQVLVAPGFFRMDQSVGDATSWKSFGKWYYDLGSETRDLPLEARSEIDALIDGLETEEEIVTELFGYLQEKSRYVSIQLGIGGWKPFTAKYVFENSYGDCKALTNYMQAALEYVGIKAEGVLIYRGVNGPKMNIDFPSNQFNHIILRVTLKNGDVIWLECTDKYLPPNHIGPDNEGKNALLITEEGGEVIQTPGYEYTENKRERYWTFVINEQGKTEVNSEIKNEGILQDNLLYTILPVSEKERLEWLERTLVVNDSKVIEYDFSQVGENDDFASYSFKAELSDYARLSSKRLFIPVNKLNGLSFSIPENEERDHPLYLPYSFSESDSVVFKTPKGYSIEALPKDVEFSHRFANFKASYEVKSGEEIVYRRQFSIKEKTIQPEDYEEIKIFFDNVKSADQQQFVLVKNE